MISAYTGRRAEQVISGAIMMVARRSRGFWMVRVAMIPGMAQAKLDSKGMNARPDRPDAAHHPIEQECGARQVARILEHQNEEEQDDDLRQKHQHAADPGEHAVDEQVLAAGWRAAPLRSQLPNAATPSLISSMGTCAHANTA